jgi:hypothetical protein
VSLDEEGHQPDPRTTRVSRRQPIIAAVDEMMKVDPKPRVTTMAILPIQLARVSNLLRTSVSTEHDLADAEVRSGSAERADHRQAHQRR